jgi:hypothetical protein
VELASIIDPHGAAVVFSQGLLSEPRPWRSLFSHDGLVQRGHRWILAVVD